MIAFDYYGTYFLLILNENTLKIFTTSDNNAAYTLTVKNGPIRLAKFSNQEGELWVLKGKSSLCKYVIGNGHQLHFSKEYSNLHGSSQITSFDISKNCMYLITLGSDHLLKVFDYNFRGGSQCQSFKQSEDISFGFFTNDAVNSFIAIGGKSQGVYQWSFVPDTDKCEVQFFVQAGQKMRIADQNVKEFHLDKSKTAEQALPS